MNRKFKRLFWLTFIMLIFLVACMSFNKSDNLTVTAIHDKIIVGETTVSELKRLFGTPSKYIKNAQKSQNLEEYWSNYEGGVNYSLEDSTNYWETVNYSKDDKVYSYTDIDSYCEYEGRNLGIKGVYFFIADGKVVNFSFNGEITDKSVAKKDKYLRQILDEDK